MDASQILSRALEAAEKYRGACFPNPAVGAALVRDGEILAVGAHKGAGLPHAEVDLLSKIHEDQVVGSTLYVTLEPCCHWGKTPPCTQLLIANRIQKVVYAYGDPNPLVNGKGAEELRKAGVQVECIPLAEIDKFYAPYTHWVKTKRPYVTAKLALSLDGKTAGPGGAQIAISREAINEFTHQMRRHSDAILTTAKTVIADNPRLNARVEGMEYPKPVYIIDSALKLEPGLDVFKTAESLTVFHRDGVSKAKIDLLQNEGVRCVSVNSTPFGLHLPEIVEHIGKDGIHDLWVEAGGTLFHSLIQHELVQRSLIYVCPVWLGSQATNAFEDGASDLFKRARKVKWIPVGRDSLCELVW